MKLGLKFTCPIEMSAQAETHHVISTLAQGRWTYDHGGRGAYKREGLTRILRVIHFLSTHKIFHTISQEIVVKLVYTMP